MITFILMSNATTRQVTTRESMLMKFVAIHCEHAFGDGGTFAKVPPSPLPGKGALTHHLQAGGGIPSGTCALRGGVSLSAESDRKFGKPHSLHEYAAAGKSTAAAFSCCHNLPLAACGLRRRLRGGRG